MLFKILHGDSSNISTDITPFHEGWCYVTHNGYFYFDINIGTEDSPNNQRIKLNAQEAEKITGYDIATIIKSSDLEIPTSKAILDALNLKQDVITGTEGQYVGFDADGNTASFDLPSEVIISDTEPTDETAEIWINTSEEWNDNIAGGASSWNDLTDKPFDENNIINKESLPEGYPYKEQSETVVFDKTITTVPLGTENGASGAQNPFTYDEMIQATQEAGIDMYEPFSLVFDGVPYTVQLVNMGSSTQYIGDYERLVLGRGGAEEYPFCIMFTPSMVVVATNDSGEHRMCISKLTETIHTMAPEFLPAGVGGGEQNAYIITATPEGSGFVCRHTYDEIMELVNNNFFVVMKINFYGTPAYFNMVYALNGDACFSGFVKMYGSGNLNVYDAYVSTDGVHLEGNPVALAGLVLSDADNKQYKISVVDGSLTATAL